MLIAAGLATGLGRVRVAGAASQVKVGVSNIPCHAATWAAVAQGFFKDEGLDASVVDTTANGPIPALSSRAIDAGTTALWNTVPPRLTPGRALGDLVVTTPVQRGCVALSVPADSDVQSLADLRGGKVAGNEFLFGAELANAGVDPDTDITWSAPPAHPDEFATLQRGEFAAVQSADGVGALMEVLGETRMIAMNNMPPSESHYCCGCIMNANAVRGDRSRAAAITRAFMRGAAWAEAHRSETAQVMRPSMAVPVRRELTQEDMEAALAMQAFIPMAEAARPLLVSQFDEYMRYGLSADPPMDAAVLVDRIFLPVTDELQTG
jgi:NitT/TauT family transport system substrate-binding protein